MGYRTGTKAVMILLLIVLGVMLRLSYREEWLFDSFRYHAMAESVVEAGYARWVFHPASLFGYYPLSYPSGLAYLLASVSALTTLPMPTVVFLFSLFTAILGGLAVYVLAREIGGFFFAFLATLIFSIAPYFVNFTAATVSGRVLVAVYFPFLVWLLTKAATAPSRRILYFLTALLSFLVLVLVHRMSQLLFVVWAAWLLTLVYRGLPGFGRRAKRAFGRAAWYRFFARRYRHKIWVFVDLLLVAVVFVALKILDLAQRGRFMINLRRLTGPYLETYTLESLISVGVGLILVILAVFVGSPLLLRWRESRSRLKLADVKEVPSTYSATFDRLYAKIAKEPDRFFAYLLLFVFAYLFIGQFFGRSFYSPSFEEFKKSQLFSGGAPWVIFANMSINYLTGHGLLFPLAFAGLVILVLLPRKTFLELFLVVLTVLFSPFLLDSRYIRLFLIPLYSILSAIALFKFLVWLVRRPHRRLVFFGGYAMLVLVFVFTVLFVNRFYYFEKNDEPIDFPQTRAASGFLRTLGLDSSLANDKNLGAVVTYAYSGLPSAPFNVYYYVDPKHIRPEPVPFERVRDDILAGRKVSSLWELKDWVFGGNYYWGRHGVFLYNNEITNPTVQRLLDDYKTETFVHYADSNSSILFNSIQVIKNKLYDSPAVSVWDLKGGRE